jgi:hypothetical protein
VEKQADIPEKLGESKGKEKYITMKTLKEFAGFKVNKTKMDQIIGGQTVKSYTTSILDTCYDYIIIYADGTTVTKYLPFPDANEDFKAPE